jgi:hypothetical protein
MSCTNSYLNPLTGCNEDLGLPMQLILVKKTFSFASISVAQALANWQTGIYSKDIFVLPLLASAEDNGTESTYEDTSWRKAKLRDGQMGFKVMYDAGIDLNTKLQSFGTAGELGVYIAFESGVILGYKNANTGKIIGFATNFVNPENYKFNFGTAIGKTSMVVSFKDARQFNQWPAVIIPSLATPVWDYSDLASLQTVKLEVVTATATKITFKAYCDHVANDAGVKIPILGLVAGDFALTTTAGAAQTITTLTATSGVDGQYEANGTGLVSGFLTLKTPALAPTKGYEGLAPVTITVV